MLVLVQMGRRVREYSPTFAKKTSNILIIDGKGVTLHQNKKQTTKYE